MVTKAKQLEEAMVKASFLLEKGIDLCNRRMIVGVPYMEHNTENEVGFPLAANFFTGLHVLENFYIPEAGKPVKEHIDIEFMSYGGDVYTSLSVYDRLIASPYKIHMSVYGPCMSGGSVILQAADKRLISANSRLMLHYGFTSDEGTSDPRRRREVEREHEHTMDVLVNIYYSRGKAKKVTKKMLEEDILPYETYVDAKKAVEYGLADEIIEPKCFIKKV